MPDHLRIDLAAGSRAAVIWASNPVSERGVAHVFRMIGAFGGPQIQRSIERMRRDPVGARLLDERPDLGAALGDMATLAAMPAGSLGRAYFEFMNHDGVVPGYLIAGLMYRDGYLDSLDWPDEMTWIVERLGATHDLTHLLSGYGTDLPGEAINICFSLAVYEAGPVPQATARSFGAAAGLVLAPPVGLVRWNRACAEAATRGGAAARRRPFHLIPWEDWLERPLTDVRAELGLRPPRHVPADGTQRWMRGPVAHRMAAGFGLSGETAARAADAKAIVEAGVPVKLLMQADTALTTRLRELVRAGATTDELIAVATA
jgi:ubiquinone biosynthesis protein COQ4